MKKIFLVSDLGCSVKVDGVRKSKTIDNNNGIIEQIKNALPSTRKIVFFVSDPTDYGKNDNYAILTFESFRKSGFNFNEELVIDNRFEGDISEELKSTDLIFLSGGTTETQMIFFENIGLRNLLNNYNGVIIGQSAGAINLATDALSSPEEESEIGKNYKWPGLAQTNINIEPHFNLNVSTNLDIRLRNELLKMSEENSLYALCDGSHIYIDEVSSKIYGEAYLIEAGKIKKINDMGLVLDVEQLRKHHKN